jgi:translation initiation factor IF-2
MARVSQESSEKSGLLDKGSGWMAKVRVYELAKEQGISSKDLLTILKDLGVEAKSHQSTIEDSTAKLVLEVITSQKAPPAAVAPAAQAKVATLVKEAPPKPKEAKAAPKQEEIKDKKPAMVEKVSSPAALVVAISEADRLKEAPSKVREPKVVQLSLPLTIGEFARKINVSANEIIKKLLEKGRMMTLNQSIEGNDAIGLAESLGIKLELEPAKPSKEEVKPEDPDDDPRFLVPRPPVVTILGHVDHGKTSLLDAIRKTNVTAGEAGGITQRIGAYTVDHNGRKIVFVDTPGHEAFTAMRARGAQVTDIAILVVAAEDGVMPQTIEAINHAKAAKVPIIVAINKIDKPQANPDRVKQQLADLDLLPEDWGGETICILVSAREKTGLEDLLEMIGLVADMHEFKANPKRKAQGIIIEAKLDRGLGPVATVLVKTGTLKLGDAVIAGTAYGKVRLLINDRGERIKKATPSIPAEIIGLSEVPKASDFLQVVNDEKTAKAVTEKRSIKERDVKMVSGTKTTLDDIFRQMQEGERKELNLIIKADGQGSVEALKHSLSRITNEEVDVSIIHAGVGTITEADLLLANASEAVIVGFNIKLDPNIKKMAEAERIDIRLYNVIYHAIEDIRAALTGMLKPIYEEVLLGRLEVRQVFKVSKIGVIAGGYIQNGKIIRGAEVRVLRDNVVIHQGRIDSLKRFKDDVKEVTEGFECGVGIEKFSGIQAGDIIEAYQLQEKAR